MTRSDSPTYSPLRIVNSCSCRGAAAFAAWSRTSSSLWAFSSGLGRSTHKECTSGLGANADALAERAQGDQLRGSRWLMSDADSITASAHARADHTMLAMTSVVNGV